MAHSPFSDNHIRLVLFAEVHSDKHGDIFIFNNFVKKKKNTVPVKASGSISTHSNVWLSSILRTISISLAL